MTYDELVTNIRSYTEIDANALPNSAINTFILMTENKILRDIDLDVFKRQASANLSTNNRFLTMPTDILTHRYLLLRTGGDDYYLEFRDPSFMDEFWPDETAVGLPRYYAVWNQSTFVLAPTPNNNYYVELGYIYKPPQLSPTNPTTWISINAPEALLYGCLVQAYSYTKGPADMIAYFTNSYKEAIQGLGIEQQGRRRRDEYRDGMLRIKLQSPSPGP